MLAIANDNGRPKNVLGRRCRRARRTHHWQRLCRREWDQNNNRVCHQRRGKESQSECHPFLCVSEVSIVDIQITRKIKRTLQKSVVEHTVAERKKWAKFGKERGNKEGPDRATTTVGENVVLKLTAGNKVRPNPPPFIDLRYLTLRLRFSRSKRSRLPSKISRPSSQKRVLARSSADCAKETTLRQSVLTRILLPVLRRPSCPQMSLLQPPMRLPPLHRVAASMSPHRCGQAPAVLESQ